MIASRRDLIKSSLGLGVFIWAKQTWALSPQDSADLPSPDFTFNDQKAQLLAGIRPYRDETFRLETETLGETFVVHNYGHGGSGITMSWGCAREVSDYIAEYRRIKENSDLDVAVLGAGIMGLTAATLLTNLGFKVRIYAKGFQKQTTSAIAGGQFCPSYIAYPKTGPGLMRFQRILRRSFLDHASTLGTPYGAVARDNYTWVKSGGFDVIPKDVVPSPDFFNRLPFAHHTTSGYRYKTLLIEPPRLMAQLQARLEDRGVECICRDFSDMSDIANLPEKIVVNCLGLGARDVCSDKKMKAIKGQLVKLPPQPSLNYLYSGHGYIFPRSDGVIVGGTHEEGVDDTTPNRKMCMEVLAYARSAFESQLIPVDPLSYIDTGRNSYLD